MYDRVYKFIKCTVYIHSFPWGFTWCCKLIILQFLKNSIKNVVFSLVLIVATYYDNWYTVISCSHKIHIKSRNWISSRWWHFKTKKIHTHKLIPSIRYILYLYYLKYYQLFYKIISWYATIRNNLQFTYIMIWYYYC